MKKVNKNILIIATSLGFIIVRLAWPYISDNYKWVILILPIILLALIFLKNRNPNSRKRKAQMFFILSLGFLGTLVYTFQQIKNSFPEFNNKYKPVMVIILLIAVVAFMISAMYGISLSNDDRNRF